MISINFSILFTITKLVSQNNIKFIFSQIIIELLSWFFFFRISADLNLSLISLVGRTDVFDRLEDFFSSTCFSCHLKQSQKHACVFTVWCHQKRTSNNYLLWFCVTLNERDFPLLSLSQHLMQATFPNESRVTFSATAVTFSSRDHFSIKRNIFIFIFIFIYSFHFHFLLFYFYFFQDLSKSNSTTKFLFNEFNLHNEVSSQL